MSTLKDLIAQKAALEQQIAAAQRAERAGAIAQARAIVQENGLTEADLFGSGKPKSRGGTGKVAPKYRDPGTGQTWTGRGRAPKWIEGRDRDAFKIA